MRIGDLARHAGVDVQTVRYYERAGLIDAPARTPAGYRAYGPKHLERLNFVRHCRSLDMPLADVKRLLALARDVNDLVQAHLERVRAKRAALAALETQLGTLRAQCTSGYIAGAILWLWAIEGLRPTAWDLAGVAVALAGMAVIVLQPLR